MNSFEDRYRPPSSNEPAADTSRLSKDELRYAGKVLALWFLAGSVLIALVTTWQNNFALSQFGGQEYLARVMTLAIPSSYGPMLSIAAACIALVMVTHRRATAAMVQPIQNVPWWISVFLALTTPIAMALIFGSSLAMITYGVGVPWADSWKGMQVAFRWRDCVSAVLSVAVTAALLSALVQRVTRVLFRFRGWVFLKCIVLINVSGVVLYAVLSAWNAIVSL